MASERAPSVQPIRTKQEILDYIDAIADKLGDLRSAVWQSMRHDGGQEDCLKCDGRGWTTHWDLATEKDVRAECDHRYTEAEMQEALRHV